MLRELTAAELRVAKEMTKCKGRQGVADDLCMSINTIKMHLRNVYLKLNIHTDMELQMVMACEALGKKFSIKELREKGVNILLSMIFLVMACTNASPSDMRRMPRRSGRRIEIVMEGGTDDGKN